MRIEYDFTPEDYFRFAEYHASHSPDEHTKKRMYFFGVALVVVGAALVLSGVGYPLRSPVYIWLALIPVLAVYSRRIRTQRTFRRGMEEARQQGYFGRCALTVSAGGIMTECETVKSQRQWRTIRRVDSGGPGVGFYLNAVNVIMVPASAFSQRTGRQAFLNAVMQYREQAAGIDTPS